MMNTTAIRTNMNSIRATNIFNQNQVQANDAFNKVSTGLRVQSVAQAPADWAVSEKMRERINSLNQANQNIQNDTAMMKTAEGAISNTVDILRSLRDSAVQATDASKTDADRVNIAKEMLSLLKQVDYNATDTRYNGKLLLANVGDSQPDVGSAELDEATSLATNSDVLTALTFQIGDDSNAIISGIQLQNMTLAGLGLTGENLAVDDFDVYTLLNAVVTAEDDAAMKTAVDTVFGTTGGDATTNTAAQNLHEALNTALNTALGAATDVGSLEQRLGYTADNVATQIENLQASDSAIRDADMAQEISNYMKWNVLSQASQYMLAQSNQNAYAVLNLLQ